MNREEYTEEHSRQYWGQRRDELRVRVRHAILDFTLLWECWEESEMWELRGGWPDMPTAPIKDEELRDGLRDMIVLALYFGRADRIVEQAGDSAAEELLTMAFRRLGYWYGYHVHDIDVGVNAERIPYADLLDNVKAGEDVPVEQLMWALQSGNVDVDPVPIREALQEAFREQLTEGDAE